MPSRDPAHLDPQLRTLHDQWHHECKMAGLDVLTTCTYRPQREQDALWALGRTVPGKKVTWTQSSEHSAVRRDGSPGARAFDFVALKNGKAIWNDTAPEWTQAGTIAERIGLQWGITINGKRRDLPHIQLRAA